MDMYQQQFFIIINFLMAVDAVITVICGYTAYSLSLELNRNNLIMAWNDFIGMVLFMMFANNYFLGRFGFYSDKRFLSKWSMLKNMTIAITASHIVLMTGAIMVGVDPFPRSFVLPYFLCTLISLIITRIVLFIYLERRSLTSFNARQILLIGTFDRIRAIKDVLDKQPSWGHQITGCLDIGNSCRETADGIKRLGDLKEFDNVLKAYGIDEVIFALPKGSPIELTRYIDKCNRLGVAVRIVPALFDFGKPAMDVERIQGIPTITYYTGGKASASGLLYKRMLDIFAGSIGFILLFIIYPFIAVAIKLDSPGPVFFKQKRISKNGRFFNLYKFRSMVTDAESRKKDLMDSSEMCGPMFKMENDPRITRVGKFLRKTSLDELPQFINVLKGEMSVVGTRPPTPDEVEQYEDWHRRRISMKPGITGLWQVSGRNKITDFNEVVSLDLQYIDGWRFWKDMLIMFKTFWVVLARKGAK